MSAAVLRIINVLAGGIYLIAGLAVIAIGIGSLLYVLLELVLGRCTLLTFLSELSLCCITTTL